MKKFAIALLLVVPVMLLATQGKPPKGAADELPKAEKAYATLKSFFQKHPKDAKAKKDFVGATVVYANASMYSPTLDRKIKYVQALKLYREALKLDPKNEEAKKSSEMIISIYKSMNRPVPKDGS